MMNTYDLKCYEKTYQDPQYWDQAKGESDSDKKELWGKCRSLTDEFHEELVYRGYLMRKSTQNT